MAILDVKQSGGSYSTLASALSSASASDTISIEGSWTVDDTTNAAISDDNLTIQTDADSKHPGYWDESQNHYRLVETAGAHALVLDGAYTVTIDGLAIEQGTTGASGKSDECFRCVPGTSDAVTIKNTLLQCSSNTEQQDCIYTGYNTSIGTITLENCVLYGAGRGGIHAQNNTNANGYSGTVNVNSCVIWNCGLNSSLELGGIGASGYDSKNWSSFNFNVHNSIVVENDSQTSGADFIEQFSTGSGIVWGVSYSIDSDNSIATVDGGGSGNLASRTATDSTSPGTGDWVIFEDITSSPYDLRIVDNAEDDAQDAHTTATAEGLTIPSTDIVGTSRPQNTDHDIGAFEIEAAGGNSQAVAGTLTTAGAVVKETATTKAGTLTTAGAVIKKAATSLTGSLTSSGAVSYSAVFHQAIAGTLTSAGVVVGKASKVLAGTLTSAGTVVKSTSISLAGTLTSAGTIAKGMYLALAGTLTTSGVVAGLKQAGIYYQAVAGTLTSSGALVGKASKKLAGTLTGAGDIVKKTTTSLAGTLTTSGILAPVKSGAGEFYKSLAGTLTSAGVLTKQTGKGLAGVLTPAGAVAKGMYLALAGTLTSAGNVAKGISESLAGTLTTSGAITKKASKGLAGALTSSGTLIRSIGKGLTGTLTSAGAVAKGMALSLAGTLTSSGIVSTLLNPVTQAIDLTLRARDMALTLESRASALTVRARAFALTLFERD